MDRERSIGVSAVCSFGNTAPTETGGPPAVSTLIQATAPSNLLAEVREW